MSKISKKGLMERDHILIVDDEPYNLKVVGSLLIDLGYNICLAKNGKEALVRVGVNKPQLILLDIIMPEMNGFDVCQKLKKDPETAHIPIIMLSGLSTEEDIAKGLECGADDFLSKPVRPLEMQARIKSHLRAKKNYDDLQEVQKMRDSLVQMVAHDLRVPLTVIKCLSSMMGRGDLQNDKYAELSGKILKGSNQAENLINDMLTVANSHTQKLAPNIVNVKAKDFLQKSIQELEPMVLEAELSVVLKIDLDDEFRAEFDPQLMERVLFNLIQNSIKFSPKNGQLSISASKLDEENWLFEVSDNGCGFEEDLDIFALYASGENNTSERKSFGLGLYFCKLVCEAHNGLIEACSNEPSGATFSVQMPITV